jgi:sortase A
MFLNHYYHLKRTTRFRRIGVGLLAAGFVFAGTAGAPLLLELQWQTGELIGRIKALRGTGLVEERAVARLPENADIAGPLAARLDAARQASVKAFELVGAAHAAPAEITGASARAAAEATVIAAAVPAAVKPAAQKTIDRMKIPGIKVDMQIAEGANEKVLNKGFAWKLPYTSTPDKGGNTVIGCHRYLYTTGSKTCFNLDKVKAGDSMVVDWKGMRYYYKVREIKIVKPSEISILNPTREAVLTVFTCTPKFTSKERLIVISDLVKTEALSGSVT